MPSIRDSYNFGHSTARLTFFKCMPVCPRISQINHTTCMCVQWQLNLKNNLRVLRSSGLVDAHDVVHVYLLTEQGQEQYERNLREIKAIFSEFQFLVQKVSQNV